MLPAPTMIYTLSLHDALPILDVAVWPDFSAMIINALAQPAVALIPGLTAAMKQDRKSTRLNSSHTVSSYAVFCLKKKNLAGVVALRVPEPSRQAGQVRAVEAP